MGKVNFEGGDGDEDEREWVWDSVADYYMTGDISMFEKLEEISSNFFVEQIKGKFLVKHWGLFACQQRRQMV